MLSVLGTSAKFLVIVSRMSEWSASARSVEPRTGEKTATATPAPAPVPPASAPALLLQESVTTPQAFFLRRFRALLPNSDPGTSIDSLDVQLQPRKPSGFHISLVKVSGADAPSASDSAVERLKQVCVAGES